MRTEPLVDAFQRHLKELGADSTTWETIEAVDDTELEERGRLAAEFAVAPYLWARAVGDRYDTSELGELLGVTRQAIASRVTSGTLLALPGRGVRWYPAWQVDITTRTIRPVVGQLLEAWRSREPDVDPLVIASWATTPQELLNDRTPAELVDQGDHDEEIVAAARATAERRVR